MSDNEDVETIDDGSKMICRGPNKISFCKMHPTQLRAP